MFNATYFQYDGQLSGSYGLQIADFNDSFVQETDALSPALSLQKTPSALRFVHSGIDYEAPPTCEFSVLSQTEIDSTMRRKILSWLVGRKQFKPLRFIGGDNDGYTYYCVFTSAKTIWVGGQCHGFRLTAQLDSQYARGTPTYVEIETAGTHTVTIHNKSDIVDGYTYPVVEFTGGSVDIVNITDDPNRSFSFSGIDSDETITVDNEVKHISSSTGEIRLGNFTSKKWLRLRPGMNTLRIVSSGKVLITCPHYAVIGC